MVIDTQSEAAIPALIEAPALSENLPASNLRWQGASEEQLAFMRAVYERQVQRSSSHRKFVGDVPAADLETVEGRHQLRTPAAADCRMMLAAAREALARQQREGGAAAQLAADIGVASGYRAASRQFTGWQRAFPRYYRDTRGARAALDGGEHGPEAIEYLVRYVGRRLAAPGYSNHNRGLAVDLTTHDSGRRLGPDTSASSVRAWKASWLFAWLQENAGRFNFHQNAAIEEPWHWEYRTSSGVGRTRSDVGTD